MTFRCGGRVGRAFVLALTAFAVTPAFPQTGEVNVYTAREPGLIQPLLDAFTAETGIKANTIFIESGLAERLEAAVPENLRDPEGHWYALSMRARVIYASKDRVEEDALTYEDLADPKWKGRVCIRSGQHPYNTSLIAAMIEKDGAEKTEAFLTGLRANLGRTAGGGDRDVARDILADICDVGIANSYYVGLMRSGAGGPEEWGKAIKVILPTFADGVGTHVNISGAAIAKNAPNRENAVKLMEFLVSPEAQAIYASANFEYPVLPGAEIDPIIAELGELKVDPLPLSAVGEHREEASKLVDKVGFDQEV